MYIKFLTQGEPNLGASGIRGVAIYYRKSLNASEVEFRVDGLKDQVWIEILYDNCKLLCGCVYRSPTGTDRSKCLESTAKVTQLIHIAYQRNPNLLICGTTIIRRLIGQPSTLRQHMNIFSSSSKKYATASYSKM